MISNSFKQIHNVTEKIAGGELSARVSTDSRVKEFSLLGESINKMAKSLESRIEELKKRDEEAKRAMKSISEALAEACRGEFGKRVDTKGWGAELEAIGMGINTLIESCGYHSKKKK
jgi:acetylornithine deacetylase/succinyl-diaminopimelate desuccinylase-like protein